jgi:hypothetical protein
LAAFEPEPAAITSARLLAFMPLAAGFASAGTVSAPDALAIFSRAIGAGEFVQFHD